MVQDGIALGKLLQSGEISKRELWQETEKKVRLLNPTLNSFVRFEGIDGAGLLEKRETPRSPLSGVPFPLKMLGQEKAGWLATNSSTLFKTHRASSTSNFVQQAEAIGLCPFGQTNAPELGFKNITDPRLYGPARNPWNPAHSPGGSSGGAAAAVASGMVPLAGASDGGGSIRIPAAFCGLIGLKPSRGTMPVGPNAWRGWQGAAIDFGLTVSVRDTEALFYGMRGVASGAPYQVPKIEWEEKSVKSRLKVAYSLESPIGSNVSSDAQTAVRQAIDFLSSEGHEVEEIRYPVNGQQVITSYYQMNGAETAAMIHSVEQGMGRKIEKNELEPMSWAIYRYGEKIAASTYIQVLNEWDHFTIQMEKLFETYDLFLTPTVAYTAPRIDQELQSDAIRKKLHMIDEQSEGTALETITEMFDASLQLTPFTQLANVTGQPGISLPTYLAENGLPLGIQFMAARGREDLLFQVSRLFEQEGRFYLPEAYQ